MERTHVGKEECRVDPVEKHAGGIAMKGILRQALQTCIAQVRSVQVLIRGGSIIYGDCGGGRTHMQRSTSRR